MSRENECAHFTEHEWLLLSCVIKTILSLGSQTMQLTLTGLGLRKFLWHNTGKKYWEKESKYKGGAQEEVKSEERNSNWRKMNQGSFLQPRKESKCNVSTIFLHSYRIYKTPKMTQKGSG